MSVLLTCFLFGYGLTPVEAEEALDSKITKAWELHKLGDYPGMEEILLPIALGDGKTTDRINAAYALGFLYSGHRIYPYENFVSRKTPDGESWHDYYIKRFRMDTDESAKWFRLGHALCPTCSVFPQAIAELYMGGPLYAGLGDPKEAVYWARVAAEQGNSLGKQILAQLILSGEVDALASESVTTLLEDSIATKNAAPVFLTHGVNSRTILLVMYLTGWGGDRNFKKALEYSDSAVNQALAAMGGIGIEKNLTDALSILRPLAEKGLRRSYPSQDRVIYLFMAKIYSLEKKLSSAREAFYWAKKAASFEQPHAYAMLGEAYFFGLGVAQDRELARLYMSLASVNGVSFKKVFQEKDLIKYSDLEKAVKNSSIAWSKYSRICDCGAKPNKLSCEVPYLSQRFATDYLLQCEPPEAFFKRLKSFR